MHQWTFVAAAYAVTLLGTAAVSLMSWRAMHRAEAQAETLAGRS
ncbi:MULTISPECIES: hypothetical protein [unclassified Sphingobium]|nr:MULTISPECIES: hypothetical protein [unclassified Sphingobium]MBG6116662.1 hypothetical protein [Sphingobium sp. JAI105]TWD07150.1 hypothetical protein FB595_10796 [Sphingobium sp. AEW010]TWD24401.1 hypothetical protein FB596_10777 [Sphingobium sp. AEW013]TWD26232.1 hypothetical protein FB594_10777 [Sphingobium sp. AEW001]